MQDRTRRIGGHRSSARRMRMHSAFQGSMLNCAAGRRAARIDSALEEQVACEHMPQHKKLYFSSYLPLARSVRKRSAWSSLRVCHRSVGAWSHT